MVKKFYEFLNLINLSFCYIFSMDAKYLNSVVAETNNYYGGLTPSTTNVLYVHGSIDPWHALGLIKTKNPQTPSIYIQGT